MPGEYNPADRAAAATPENGLIAWNINEGWLAFVSHAPNGEQITTVLPIGSSFASNTTIEGIINAIFRPN